MSNMHGIGDTIRDTFRPLHITVAYLVHDLLQDIIGESLLGHVIGRVWVDDLVPQGPNGHVQSLQMLCAQVDTHTCSKMCMHKKGFSINVQLAYYVVHMHTMHYPTSLLPNHSLVSSPYCAIA